MKSNKDWLLIVVGILIITSLSVSFTLYTKYEKLNSTLNSCRAYTAQLEEKISDLEDDLDNCQRKFNLEDDLDNCQRKIEELENELNTCQYQKREIEDDLRDTNF